MLSLAEHGPRPCWTACAPPAWFEQRQGLNPRQQRVESHNLADAILRLAQGTRARVEQSVYLTLFRQAPQTAPV